MGFVAEDGIAHVIIVRHLYFVEQDDVLKFCRVTYYCTFTNYSFSSYKCTMSYLCAFTYYCRTCNICGFKHICFFMNPYISIFFNIFILRKGSAKLYYIVSYL